METVQPAAVRIAVMHHGQQILMNVVKDFVKQRQAVLPFGLNIFVELVQIIRHAVIGANRLPFFRAADFQRLSGGRNGVIALWYRAEKCNASRARSQSPNAIAAEI